MFVYIVRVSRRRNRRRKVVRPRSAEHLPGGEVRVKVVVREAAFVERLAYTRSQAAEALGISRSTFIRRVLPFVETIELVSGAKLIPVDEVERFVQERRRVASRPPGAPARPGRPRS